MVTSNFSLFLSSLLMCVFISVWGPVLVPYGSASNPAGEELAWPEGAAKNQRSIQLSREVSSWPEAFT